MKLGRLALALACLISPIAHADVVFSGYIGFDVTGSDQPERLVVPETDDESETVVESESVDEEGEIIPAGSPTLTGDSSSLNVAVRHTTDAGFTAYGNYRLDASLSGSGLIGENIWIGLSGPFGDVRVGEVPDASQFGRTAGAILPDSSIGGENDGFSYRGFYGPVNFGVNWSPENNSDRIGAGAKITLRGYAIGFGIAQQGTEDGDIVEATAGLAFSVLNYSLGFAYQNFDNNRETVAGKIGTAFSGISVTLTYEQEIGSDELADNNATRLDIGTSLNGGILMSGRLNAFTSASDPSEDVLSYRIQVGIIF